MYDIPIDIGHPPMSYKSNNVRANAWPLCTIRPCTAQWADSISQYALLDAWSQVIAKSPEPGSKETEKSMSYYELLNSYGYSYKCADNRLHLYFIPDSLPTESFTNEYGDTFISKVGDFISEAASDLSQISGGRTLPAIAENTVAALSGSTNSLIKGIGELGGESLKTIGELGSLAGQKVPGLSAAASWAGKLLAGQRIDFPAVWKNSVFQPTYGITIKLYNPNPGDNESTHKYILGPLTAILLLALPYGMSETYSWPFFCKVNAPGLFTLPAAGISNITITKGGDQGLVAFNQRLGAVDVRIDFQNLFTTMLMGQVTGYDKRPSLKNYLENLIGGREIASMYKENASPETTTESATVIGLPQTPGQPSTAPTERTNSTDATKASILNEEMPDPFKIPNSGGGW